ncbi:hypothetical protein C8F01DRAFT_1031417 [Mycena amicta]|nr:hypothetical protein C8F01DRAFT_1031417 [Mycena amicta]
MEDDFFSVVGGSLMPNDVDDTKSFAEAIAARFNASADNVLTARLFPPPRQLSAVPVSLPSSPSSFTPILPQSLSPWLDDPRTLIVDIRPHAAYATARMARAISLSVPSTLLKRPLFSLQRLSAMLPSASARTRLSAWKNASRIVVYDADSTTIGDTSNINGLLRKFRAESDIPLGWVVGGFQAVWVTRRDLVDAIAPSAETETEDDDPEESDLHPRQRVLRAHNLPRAAFSMSSTTQAPRSAQGPFPHHRNLPSGKPQTSAFNPFFDSVRQNMELAHGITERIPLRLSRGIRRRISDLPFEWLRLIASKAAPLTPPLDPTAIRGHQDSSGDESSDSSISKLHRWRHFSPAPSPGSIISPPPPSGATYVPLDANIDEGTESLAMQFYRIELAEQRRLMNVLEHHARESSHIVAGPSNLTNSSVSEAVRTPDNFSDHPFSITAGVEKGSKNRYRNIWPFEHARVRLHRLASSMPAGTTSELDISLNRHNRLAKPVESPIRSPKHDDYVNASFVQPIGTRRRYIATQGPLESTYGDFWTLLWQQNIHVIVMLTKEVEGAVIKCGNYWHSGRYGPLRIELLGCAANGCTGVCQACSGISSDTIGSGAGDFFSGFRPTSQRKNSPLPSPSSQIIKRTIRLTHEGHPHAPPRRVVQLQYLGWPDMNVPEDARGVLSLVWEVAKVMDEVDKETPTINPNDFAGIGDSDVDEKTGILGRAIRDGNAAAPVLLHCSAGVGRTGGFIIVDAILDAIRMELRELYTSGRGHESPALASAVASRSGSASASESEGFQVPTGSLTGSGSGSGSGSGAIAGIAARIRAANLMSTAPTSEDDAMDVDRNYAKKAAEPTLSLPTPMQVDAEMELGMSETRRWAQRVADTDVVSAFAPSLFPSSATSSSTSLPLAASFPTTPLGAPFQLQPPSLMMPRPSDDVAMSGSFPPKATLPAVPLSVRRGHLDHRLRTTSDPSAAGPNPGNSKAAPWLVPHTENPTQSFTEHGLARLASVAFHRSVRSADSAEATPAQETLSVRQVDYKQPRALHVHDGPEPIRLSTLDSPISEVLQDMREQRMSLCQSLRQYVFVHAAIIEGALMVADEERARARVALHLPPRGVASPRGSRPRLILGEDTQSSPSTGKRLASPTELTRENKMGEIALSKRPSLKRKQGSSDEYTPPLATFPPP